MRRTETVRKVSRQHYNTAIAKSGSDHDPTFVVFFTDGEPSQYSNFYQAPHATDSWKYFFAFLGREGAKDEARLIVNSGLRFYTMFAYGSSNTHTYNNESCTDLLENMMEYAYDTTSSLEGKYYFDAANATQMDSAFSAILHGINSVLGINDVVMNDSVTSLTSVGVSMIQGITDPAGFKYTRSGGPYGAAGQEWAAAPIATYSEGSGITWDLKKDRNNEPITLEDGVTYTLSLTVWPSQTAYDYVTQLNNGFIDSIDDIPLPDRLCFTQNSEGKYEVITNPESGRHGDTVTNEITYSKEQSQTVPASEVPTNPPTRKEDATPVHSGEGVWPETTTWTWYEDNGDGTWTEHTETDVITAFNPPDKNMVLDDTAFKIEKKWDAGRPSEIVAFLYDLTNGQIIEANRTIDFVVKQVDDPEQPKPFTTVKLGDPDHDNMFNWTDEVLTDVTVNHREYHVGTTWREGLDISFGLMLNPTNAQTRGIVVSDNEGHLHADDRFIPIYLSEEDHASGNIAYFVLEKGHDYKIEEPSLDYRFEFETEVYHPMLVDGNPESVRVHYYKDANNKEYGLLQESGDLSALHGTNILRGELKMDKVVLGEHNNSDLFTFNLTLENDGAPFTVAGEHVPWYGVQETSDGEVLFFHKIQPNADGSIEYVHERDACVNGNYSTGGLRDGYAGNIMNHDSNSKVTATITIKATETWTIANVPGGTTYTIVEVPTDGYEFVSAEQKVYVPYNSSDVPPTDVPAKVESPAAPSISGTVHINRTTQVEFTNKRSLEIEIIKVDVNDLEATDPQALEGAAFTLQKYDDDGSYTGLDTSWGSGGEKAVTEKQDSPGTFTVNGLKVGYYKLVETAFPDGYVKAGDDPIFRIVRNDDGILRIELLEMNKQTGEGTVDEDNKNDDVVIENNTLKIRVANTPGEELPAAGGPGLLCVYLLGAVLVAAGGVVLTRRRVS